MRIIRIYCIFLTVFLLINIHGFCQQDMNTNDNSGNNAAATENNNQPDQDDMYFFTPTIVVTPIYSLTPQEKKAWALLSSTKSYIDLTYLDLDRYEKFTRENLDQNLLDMKKIISSIYTAASIYERDKIEYRWAEAIKAPVHNLMVIKGYVKEFKKNYNTMKQNQRKVNIIVKKHSDGIQNIDEVMKSYDSNKEDLKQIHKKIIYFENLYNTYGILYAKTVKEKETKINKLIADNKALHKP